MKKLTSMLLAAMMLISVIPALAHEGMDHHAVTPTDTFTPAEDPAYPVGAEVIMLADHMPGMAGAAARVSGAFDTVLYAINYTNADTGEEVLWHRWVIHEEIQGSGDEPWKGGDQVILLPGHISGMGGEGARAGGPIHGRGARHFFRSRAAGVAGRIGLAAVRLLVVRCRRPAGL